jgi:hypothetical protein
MDQRTDVRNPQQLTCCSLLNYIGTLNLKLLTMAFQELSTGFVVPGQLHEQLHRQATSRHRTYLSWQW